MKTAIAKFGALFLGASFIASAWGMPYRTAGTGTAPNVWTRNYSGVMAEAKTTGYPVLIVVVDSDSCGHCHLMNQLTLSSAEFAALEKDETFYCVMMDYPYAGASSDWSRILKLYLSYFDYGMYPLIAVLRRDGSVYGSFGNRTTDSRNVAADLRRMIVNLSAEQTGNGGMATSQPVPVLSLSEWAARLKGKANGIVFDGGQNLAGSFVLNITAKGKATAKFTSISGKTTVKGMLSVKDNVPQIVSGALSLSYDAETGVWRGSWNGNPAYASTASASAYSSLYTASATNSTQSGYVTVTLKNGKGKVAGLVGGKNKINVNGAAVVLPAAIIAEELGDWGLGVAAAFVPAIKNGKFSGGIALGQNGKARAALTAFGAKWAGGGAKCATNTDLAALGETTLRLVRGEEILEVPVRVLGSRKISAGANDYDGRLSAAVKKGTFKGKLKVLGAKYTLEGALIKEGSVIVGVGVSYGAGVHVVEIGEAVKEE